ncbi:hypothetical protein OIU76_020837 [Salix suchowensis]|nr:hypothetical protein OIU76_020837 [Salix suchowensis]
MTLWLRRQQKQWSLTHAKLLKFTEEAEAL